MKGKVLVVIASAFSASLLTQVSSPAWAVPPAAKAAPSTKSALSTASVLKNARKAVALAGKGLKEGKVDTRSKAVVPFVKSLKALASHLNLADSQLTKKDKGISKTIASAARESRILEITFSHSGIKNETVAKGVKVASESVLTLLRETLVAGAKKSAGNSANAAKGKEQYEKLRASNTQATADLEKLRTKLKSDKKASPALVKTVDHLYSRSKSLSNASYSGGTLADALMFVADIAGLYAGWSYYIDPSYQSYWSTLGQPINQSRDWLYSSPDYYTVDWDYYTHDFSAPSYYSTVDLSDADVSAYDTYIDSSYDGTDYDVDSDDIGDYSGDDVALAADDADYLEDEGLDDSDDGLDDSDDSDEAADVDDTDEGADEGDDAADVDEEDDQDSDVEDDEAGEEDVSDDEADEGEEEDSDGGDDSEDDGGDDAGDDGGDDGGDEE